MLVPTAYDQLVDLTFGLPTFDLSPIQLFGILWFVFFVFFAEDGQSSAAAVAGINRGDHDGTAQTTVQGD